MNDVIKFGKKLFSASVVGVTIAWSMGLAAFVPVAAQAATCPELEAGDLFKATGASAVYYLTASMERAYFPHVDVFNSWNLSFNDVVTVSGECLFAYPAATVAGINYRPGSRLVKLSDASPVFAVTPGNKLVQVTGESAAALYGTNWTSVLRDVSPFHWASYTDTRTTWSESKPHDGQFVKKTGETTVYWVKDGMLHQVDGSNVPDVRTVSAATFATLSVASGSVTVSSAYANPTQVDGSAPSASTGALTVSVASNTSASKVVPGGAQGVEFLAFAVRAGSEASTLEQITLKRAGIGNRTDIEKVYLYHNGIRLDNGRTLNSDDEVTFNVNKTISANSTETFWVKADMNTVAGSATAGSQNYFEITTASEVDGSGTVGGSFPVRGNAITLGAQDISSITLLGQGSNTAAKIGENGVVVSEFDASAASTDDVELTSITLKQKGTAPASLLTNVKLMQGGTTVAMGVVSGDWVKFDFTQKVTIEAGDTKRFKVYADLGIADTNDTVELVLDEEADVMAYSMDFPGSLAGVTNTYTTSQSLSVTIEGGKINVDLEGTNEDVRVDQDNVVFGTFSILATAEDIDVDTMEFELVKTGITNPLEDLRLRDKNGKGSYSLEDTDTCVIGSTSCTFTAENLILTKGTTYEFEILGDVPSSVTSGQTYYFTWAAAQVTAEGVSSDNTVSANDFSSASLTGPTMTVNPSKLTIRQSALSNETVVNGTKNVLVFRGTLEAGSTSDITVTSLTVAATSTDQAWDGVVDGLKLFIDDVQVSNDNTVTSEEAVFTGFSKVVPAGSANKVTFEVYADLTDGSTVEMVQAQVEDADATDEDDDTVNAVDSTNTTVASGNPVVGSRIVTISGTGTLTAVLDSNYTGLRNDFYVIAGTQKQLAGRVQLKALYEDVELEDLVVTVSSSWSNTSTVEATFDTLNVYADAAMTELLGTADVTRGTVTIENVDFVVPADTTKYIYLGLNLNSVGTGDNGTATPSTSIFLALEQTGTTANGVSSNDDINPTVTATEGNDIIVAGATVSNLATSFAGGNLAGGEQVFFTFAVTANAGSNTDNSGDDLDLYLTQLKLSLSSDVDSVTSTKLCRVSTGNCLNIYQTTPVSSTVNNTTFYTPGASGYVDVTGFTNSDDERVDNGQTALYELRGTFSGVTDAYAQGSIQDVETGGIVWGYDLNDDSTLDYIHASLLQMEPRSSGYPDITGAALN